MSDLPRVVYFSSVSENTHRFVKKLGLRAQRIPLRRTDPELCAEGPYVLIVPTYGGCVVMTGNANRYVPRQVVTFLNRESNRSLLRGVIAAGNTNFGPEYARAGEIISTKCQVPYLYRFELMGTPEDVQTVREGLQSFWDHTVRHESSIEATPTARKHVS